MNDSFKINYRMSHGNMHIDLEGIFNKNSAQKVLNFFAETYQGTGRVFMNTAKLHSFTNGGIQYLKECILNTSIVAKNLYFKGEAAKAMVPEGGRVIIINHAKKSSCACGGTCGGKETGHGNCKVCKCAMAKKRANQKQALSE